MDPVTLLGAVSASVQLFGTGLAMAGEARGFLSSVKNARGDIETLRRTLDESESLMSCLQKQALRIQQLAESELQQLDTLPRSMHDIARQFLDDVSVLKRSFPANTSPTLLQRVSFTLDKRRVSDITRRLQQRKSSASLALELLGRINDVQHQKAIAHLGSVLQNIEIKQEADFDRQIEQIQALSTAVRRQSHALRAVSGSAILAADSGDVLGNLIQAELRSQLEPMMQRLDGIEAVIFNLASAIRAQFQIDGAFKAVATAPRQGRRSIAGDDDLGDAATVIGGLDEREEGTLASRSYGEQRPSHVKISQVSNGWTSGLGIFQLCVEMCRTRSSGVAYATTERFFNVHFEYIPPPWIARTGLSLLYSTGPRSRGYYDILPSIRPFRVIPFNSRLWAPIWNDDVFALRVLLAEGKLSLRDVNRGGSSVLLIAALNSSFKTMRFLLTSDISYLSLAPSQFPMFEVLYGFLFGISKSKVKCDVGLIELMSSICHDQSLEGRDVHERTDLDDLPFDHWDKTCLSRTWNNADFVASSMLSTWLTDDPVVDEDSVRDLVEQFQHKSIIQMAFVLSILSQIHDLEDAWKLRPVAEACFANLKYASSPGDTFTDIIGWLRLAFLVLETILENGRGSGSGDVDDYDLDAFAVRILSCVIRAGVDVHLFGTIDNLCRAWRMAEKFDMARWWVAALIECGYDPAVGRNEACRWLVDEQQRMGAGGRSSAVDAGDLDKRDRELQLPAPRKRLKRRPDEKGVGLSVNLGSCRVMPDSKHL